MEQAIRTGNYFVTADRQARTLDQGQTRSDQGGNNRLYQSWRESRITSERRYFFRKVKKSRHNEEFDLVNTIFRLASTRILQV